MSRRILVLTSCFTALIGSAAGQTKLNGALPRTPACRSRGPLRPAPLLAGAPCAPKPVMRLGVQRVQNSRSQPHNGLTGLRTPNGQPDIQGIWSFATLTPFERPAELAAQEFFTKQEAAEYERNVIERGNMDRRDGGAARDVERAYNDFWWDRGTKVVKTLRTSLIVDPKDGKIPPLTAAAQARQAERRASSNGHEFDGPENRPLFERCLMLQGAGAPTTPTAYNNNTQIIQTPGFVVIHNEMGHEVRVIPLDGRPHLPPAIHQWKGDSRGRWEGDTLVVETTNFSDKNSFRGSGPHMRLTERFRRVDADTLLYQFTVDDPETFTRPWTAEIPLNRTPGPIFEYACHEGNYALRNVLAGARAQENATEQTKKEPK